MAAASHLPIRIAVASDLHAFSLSGDSPSYLKISEPESLFKHPISALLDLIKREDLRADILLSPGDLGDRADANGIKYSWAALDRLSTELHCDLFTATAGNHDLDSRLNSSDHDPLHILQGLVPSFPLQDDVLDNHYWARKYVIRDCGSLRLVILNSSAYHGYTEIEKNFGRIDDQTLQHLEQALIRLDPLPINVLLCHHHPHSHSELSLGEADVMKNGQLLLDLLGKGPLGRWLVIHGHKHHPKIAYAAGSSVSPTVLAAGSLCAILSGSVSTAARNQFYIIEIDPPECTRYGLVGQCRAWDWSSGNGWIKASATRSGLPPTFGFGLREDPLSVAHRISNMASASPDPISWRAVEKSIPEIRFLLPQDLIEAARLLEERFKFSVPRDGSIIVEVGRSIA